MTFSCPFTSNFRFGHVTKVPSNRLKLHSDPFLNDTKIDFNDQEKCCIFIINHGANANGTIDNTDPDRMTPLHRALWSGYDRIGESLIRAGANINAVWGSKGWTPFHSVYMSLESTLAGERSLTLFSLSKSSKLT